MSNVTIDQYFVKPLPKSFSKKSPNNSIGTYSGKVYPSGDFTIGRISNPPAAARDKETHPLSGINVDSYHHDGQEHKIYDYDDRNPHLSNCPPMGLSDATNSHKPRTKRGQGGITSLGKRKVRSACALLDKSFRRRCATLGTCTIPGVTDQETEILDDNWSEIVRQFMQEIKRQLERRGCKNLEYVLVSEIQENRYRVHKVVGLHIHFLIQGRNKPSDPWAISKEDLRRIWQRIIENFLKRPVDCSAATRVESPRKSLGKEMGKYISKGSKITSQLKRDGKGHLLPSSYWGMSRSLSQRVDQATVKLTGDDAYWFLSSLNDFGAGIVYRQICLEQYGGICVAWCGYITDQNILSLMLDST
jgi:hypothetical protein